MKDKLILVYEEEIVGGGNSISEAMDRCIQFHYEILDDHIDWEMVEHFDDEPDADSLKMEQERAIDYLIDKGEIEVYAYLSPSRVSYEELRRGLNEELLKLFGDKEKG